jgi:hypothetical protein
MIWELLLIYQMKHFLCDYPLQGRYMLGKFKKYPDYLLPLAAHALVHGVATFLIALIFNPKIAFSVGALDFCVHFIVDRIKASPELLGRFKALSANEMKDILSYVPSLGEKVVMERWGSRIRSNVYFWWALGADQMAHHLTHYAIIWLLLH